MNIRGEIRILQHDETSMTRAICIAGDRSTVVTANINARVQVIDVSKVGKLQARQVDRRYLHLSRPRGAAAGFPRNDEQASTACHSPNLLTSQQIIMAISSGRPFSAISGSNEEDKD
jgi:hypothetical protein